MKRIAFLSMLIIIMCVLLAGCGRSSPLVGTWERGNDSLVFKRDGSGAIDRVSSGYMIGRPGRIIENFTWEVSGGSNGTIVIRTEHDETITGNFEAVGSTLILERIDSTYYGIWTKQ